jgi:hypothetical protein
LRKTFRFEANRAIASSPSGLSINKDPGEIVPHGGRFPAAVERALFLLLLAPWEAWSRCLRWTGEASRYSDLHPRR